MNALATRDGRGRPGLAWATFAALLAACSLLAASWPAASLDWQAQRAWSEPWRWWTAAFVHLSPLHLTANLAGCVVVGAFGWAARLPRRWVWAWVGAWPVGQLALLAVPGLARYGGLSGLLHAGVAVAAVGASCTARGEPRKRWIGLAVLGGLALKVLVERPWAGAVQPWPGWDIGVVPAAHATGALAGLAWGLVACATSRVRGLADTAQR
jgi:rhomboid family GlyGly-CTERM serine protease